MKFYQVLGVGICMGFVTSCASFKDSVFLISKSSVPVQVSKQFSFTEGPSADSKGNVYFTDQPNNAIYKWTWKDNSVQLFSKNTGRANGTFFDSEGNLITCSDENGELWKFNVHDGSHVVLMKNIEGKRPNGPNDLWIDSSNGIYFTDPLYERNYWKDFKQEIPTRHLYYRNTNGNITTFDSFVQPNGIVGSNKQGKLYVSDLYAEKTFVYDIVGEGKLSNKRVFCEMGSDGMTLDEKGNLYLTNKGVTVFNPEGKKILHIPINEDWTGNVTFAGRDFKTLFITASKSIYTLKMNVAGEKR